LATSCKLAAVGEVKPDDLDDFLKNVNTAPDPKYIDEKGTVIKGDEIVVKGGSDMDKIIKERITKKQNADKILSKEGDSDAYKIAKNEIGQVSEKIGVQAGIDYMSDFHPDFELAQIPQSGKGEFDLIFKKGDKYIIIETKGGQGKLGNKMVGEQRFSQGTRKYAQGTTTTMKDKGLAEDLALALGEDDVRYFYVEQKINTDSSLGTRTIKEFKIYGN